MSHEALLDTNVVESASGTGTLTTGSVVPTGRTVTVAVVWESGAGTVPTATVTDDRSNTYTVDVPAGANGNTTVALAIARGRVTTQLEIGDDITVTLDGETRTRWALQADSFDDVDASPLDETASNNNPGSATALSSGTTATTAQAYELAIAAFGLGAGRDITIPEGWSGTASVETNAGSTDRALQVIYKYTSATGTQEGTLTIDPASTYAGCIATYTATEISTDTSAPPPGLRAQYRNLLIR